MSGRASRFVIVRTDDGFYVSIRARNGRKVFTSEVYTSRAAAERAIDIARSASALYATKGPAALIDERQAVTR